MLQWVSQHHHQMSQLHSDKFLLSCKTVNSKGVFILYLGGDRKQLIIPRDRVILGQ